MLYDANGNVTNIVSGTTTNRLLWSARNQLTNMTGAVAAYFLYDHQHREPGQVDRDHERDIRLGGRDLPADGAQVLR